MKAENIHGPQNQADLFDSLPPETLRKNAAFSMLFPQLILEKSSEAAGTPDQYG